MDTKQLLKVYNAVNDEKRSRLNIKFIGVLAGFLLAVVALTGFFLIQGNQSPAGGGEAAASQREYVGLSAAEIPSAMADSHLVDARMAQWEAEHPGAHVEKREPVESNGVIVGYWVTYREP